MASRISAICLAFIRLRDHRDPARRAGRVLVGDFLQQLFDAILVADAVVESNWISGARRRRRRWPICRRMNPAARSSARAVFFRAVAISEARVEHARVLQIGAHLDAGDRSRTPRQGRAGRARSCSSTSARI